jgi:hypothetical protein
VFYVLKKKKLKKKKKKKKALKNSSLSSHVYLQAHPDSFRGHFLAGIVEDFSNDRWN